AFAAAALSDKPAAGAAASGDGKVATRPPPAEPITLTCPFCAEEVKFDADMGGKQAPCPNPECRRIIKVPKPKDDKPRDWREVQSGRSAALANQPAKLEGAWGTSTDKAKVSAKTLEDAGAIEYDEEPVGVGGWIRRGALAAVVLGVIVFAFIGLNRRSTENEKQKALNQALELVDKKKDAKDKTAPAVPPAWAAVIYLGAGEFHARANDPKKAREYFGKARANLLDDTSVNGDLLRPQLAAAEILLGGNDD